jgi:hypothetical protein
MTEAGKQLFVMALLGLAVTACATLQSVDPVQTPPAQFRKGTTATVEFLPSHEIIPRCIERGAKMLANACADTKLITITNPCEYPRESYAKRLCHEMGHINGWNAAHQDIRPASESPQALALN